MGCATRRCRRRTEGRFGPESSSINKHHANEFFAAPPDVATALRTIEEHQRKTLGQ